MVEKFNSEKYSPQEPISSGPNNNSEKQQELQATPKETKEDENTLNIITIIGNNFSPDVFDYYMDISDEMSKIDTFKNTFIGAFPNHETFISIPLPLQLLEKEKTNIKVDPNLNEQLNKLLSKISDINSPERSEYAFIINASTSQNGELNLESLSQVEDPRPKELDTFTVTDDMVGFIDQIISKNKESDLNTFIFCHNHPNITKEEASKRLAVQLDQETINKYDIKYPGYNLSTADIEQYIFLRNNTFANSRTGVRFLYGVFLPDSELVLLDIINKDGKQRIVKIN